MIRIGPGVLALLSGIVFSAGLAMPTGASAEGCSQWDVSGHWNFVQSNGFGFRVELTQNYPTGELYGNASYFSKGSGTVQGTVHGWIRGDAIELDTSWGGIYTGSVTFDRFLEGYTRTKNSSQTKVGWGSTGRLVTCRDVAAPAAPAKPVRTLGKKKAAPAGPKGGAVANKPGIEILATPAAPKNMATVTGDVDIYDVPGGGGTVIGVLAAGRKVAAVCQADQWCKVTDALPGRTGWVWGEFLAF